MQLQDLFNHCVNTTDEALTELQKESAFIVACSIFFAEVNIIVPKDTDDLFMQKCTIETEELEHYRVLPKSFDDFELKITYYEDFRMVCEYVILTTSFKNLNMLKNIGVEESIAQIPTSYMEIRELLRRRHNIATGIKTIEG